MLGSPMVAKKLGQVSRREVGRTVFAQKTTVQGRGKVPLVAGEKIGSRHRRQ
jgi:hypothetical protein